MAKTSKIFYVLVGLFLFLIVALIGAIYQQRQGTHRAMLKDKLELDARRMELISEKARQVTSQVPLLKERLGELEGRWQQLQGRLYNPEEKAQLETVLQQITQAAHLELTGIEAASVEEQETFKVHTFQVRFTGPLTNLPAWADAFFRQRRLAMLDRVSVVSPDYTYQKVRFKATIRYFEPKDASTLVPGTMPMEKLEVPLDYLTGNPDSNDPIYGQALAAARQKEGELKSLKGELTEAQKLEKQIAGLEKLLASVRELEAQVRLNRTTTVENIPTLYIRARASELGAAMLIQGKTARFPDVASDE